MKILHVGKYFPPFSGGLENYLRDLVGALAGCGIPSTVLVHRHQWSLRSLDEETSIAGHAFRIVRCGRWARLLFAPLSPAFPGWLRRLIRESGPDILHFHLPNPSAFFALLLPSARRLPWVVHWQSDVVTGRQGWAMKLAYGLYRPFERAFLQRASAIVASSQPYLESSEPLRPWRHKCHVVPLGVDRQRLPRPSGEVPSGRSATSPDAGLRVLAVGRLTYYKGFRYLLEAVAQTPAVSLDLVGTGDEEDALKRSAAALGLGGRVHFLGSVDDATLARLMNGCDCLCLPSIERTEAFGMVLLEAMHFGKATVVSDVPGSGMGWIVQHGVTGLKVPPADPGALAGAFRTLAADRERLADMGQRGRERFEQMFTIEASAAAVAAVYEDVLAGRAPPSASGST